jgi:transketolase
LLALTRQNIPTLDRSKLRSAIGLTKGAYVIADLGEGKPQIILMASGSELSLVIDAGYRLVQEGVNVRIVSFPSWELFELQSAVYQNEVLPPSIKVRIAVEAGVTQGWERWVGCEGHIMGINQFGASAPYKTIYEKYGLTVENIVLNARSLLGIEI